MKRRYLWLSSLLLLLALMAAAIWGYYHGWFTPTKPPVVIITPPTPPLQPSIPPVDRPPTQPPIIPSLPPTETPMQPPILKPTVPKEVHKVIDSVFKQVETTRSYDPAYKVLKYPGGDVPPTTGVCADVIVRAFRANGVDLQKEVHEDMLLAFNEYPKKWKLPRPDTNIDHRRVYNLMRFFERKGKALPITANPDDYKTGDVIAWDLGTGQAHIGIVLQFKTDDGQRPLMGHNIGEGTSVQDVLFAWPIIGHYRYFPLASSTH